MISINEFRKAAESGCSYKQLFAMIQQLSSEDRREAGIIANQIKANTAKPIAPKVTEKSLFRILWSLDRGPMGTGIVMREGMVVIGGKIVITGDNLKVKYQ